MTSSAARCCICATETDRGVIDPRGRFVCEDCLERARQTIVNRRAREAQQKLDAVKEQQVAQAERDNALVLELRESINPALELLCPSCGRLIMLDTGGCRSCGYGVEEEQSGRKRSLFSRRRSRSRAAPPQLAPDLSWFPEPNPRVTRALPWVIALILLATLGAGFVSPSMRIASEVLAVCLHGAFTLIVLLLSLSRGAQTMMFLLAPVIVACALILAVQRTRLDLPGWAPWVATGAAILFHSWFVAHNVRGMLKTLFLITAFLSLTIITRHVSVNWG
jgi:hypothetical protein